jgi:hypothetical protein
VVIDCTKEQHERLQALVVLDLAKYRLPNRPELGEDVDSGACWDLGVCMSELAIALVDDGTGSGTTVRACVEASNTLVDGGSGNGTTVRACVKAANTKKRAPHFGSCSTCKVVLRAPRSDMC